MEGKKWRSLPKQIQSTTKKQNQWNQQVFLFLEKINIYPDLSWKRQKTQITNINNERGNMWFYTYQKDNTRIFWTLCQNILQLRGNEQIHWKTQTTRNYLKINRVLPWWFRGKESTCQYRRPCFNPWSLKIPEASEQLSSCTKKKKGKRINRYSGSPISNKEIKILV